MRHRFDPARPSRDREFLALSRELSRAGDVVAAAFMPVYLALVAYLAALEGVSAVSVALALAVAVNCWPAARCLSRRSAA